MANPNPSPTPAALPNLDTVYNKTSSKISTMETNLTETLSALKDGGELTQTDLFKLQYQIARYTITASTYSSVMKEISDSLKQTANKIG